MQRLLCVAALLALVGAVKHHAECVVEAEKLLFLHESPQRPHGTNAGSVPERAVDYCALKSSADQKYMCAYFGDFVKDAYSHVHKETPVSPASFCAIVEDHANRMGTQIEGVHALRLGEVVGDETCVTDVSAAMSPDDHVVKDALPDFWYLFCIHAHDCEHAIPSRTKWCKTNAIPHLSANTCELLREDAVTLTKVKPQDTYSAPNVCGWFTSFVGMQAARLEAYEYTLYGETSEPSLIPKPGQSDHALMESRLTNGANSHWIRDHSAHPVTWSAAGPVAILAAMLVAQ